MKIINTTYWADIEKTLPVYGFVNAKRVVGKVDFFLAVDHEGFRHVLLPLDNLGQAITDENSRGLKVYGRELEVEGIRNPFLDVKCTYKGGHDAFNLIISEIFHNTTMGVIAIDAVKTTLARWRRFWGNTPGSGLSPEQLRGLFGELWFLLVWLLPYDLNNVVHWVGATGARHDFQWPDFSIEAKATESIRGHMHHINGLDQLELPESGVLYLFSLRIREEPSSTNSLVSIIERIGKHLDGEPSLLDLFEERLAKAGYSPVHAEKYSETKIRIVSERLYNINDKFPRITINSFRLGLPRGVERVEYEINLESCPELCLADKPNETIFQSLWK